jgi:hypothetical protein
MTTRATDLINIENCINNNDYLGAVMIWNESYHGITKGQFLSCLYNCGDNEDSVVDSLNSIINICKDAIEELT